MENSSISESGKLFPNFLRLLFFVEMWERFSYYGMRALLVLFLTSHFGFEDKKAYAVYSLFAAITYTGPIFGGLLADKLMGFRNMVFIGGIVIAFGHIMMTLAEQHEKMTYLGLALIAIGTGLFKGNITNLLGACYKEGDPDRSRGFTLLYVSVNVGSSISAITCAYVAAIYGWSYGFGLASIGMILGLITFMRFQHILESVGVSPRPDLVQQKFLGLKPFVLVLFGSLAVSILVAEMLADSALFANVLKYFGLVILGIFMYLMVYYKDQQRQNMIVIAIMIVFSMMFYALEMQLGSLMNLFAKRNVDNQIFGIMIPAAASQAINPLSVVFFGFIFSTVINLGKAFDSARILFATLTMAISFFVLYFGCLDADAGGKVPYVYLALGIGFMGMGEIFIAPIVQSYVALLSPAGLKGFMMGIMMLSLAFSNLAGIIISEFMSVPSIGGEVDTLQSLSIYKAGFLDIAKFNIYLAIAFIPFGVYVHRIIKARSG